jgi:hypothetical protein
MFVMFLYIGSADAVAFVRLVALLDAALSVATGAAAFAGRAGGVAATNLIKFGVCTAT